MLWPRTITGVLWASLMLIAIFLLSELSFKLFIALIVIQGAREWANIANFTTAMQRGIILLATLALLLLLNSVLMAHSDWALWLSCALFLWWLLVAGAIFVYPKGSGWLQSRWSRLFLALPTLGALWLGLVWLKSQESSALLLTWLMMLVWGADVGAYFVGRAFGERKLAPLISPGKTWAGAFGGMLVSMLVSPLVAYLYLPALSWQGWLALLLLSLLLVVLSVIGDLFESLLKRAKGIKDSSDLLPGHGGVLDRIDSLCAATPCFVLLWFVLAEIG